MFLTDEELCHLTGYQRSAAVKRWLDDNGYRYHVPASGWPRVLRSVVVERLGGGSPAESEPQLNLS